MQTAMKIPFPFECTAEPNIGIADEAGLDLQTTNTIPKQELVKLHCHRDVIFLGHSREELDNQMILIDTLYFDSNADTGMRGRHIGKHPRCPSEPRRKVRAMVNAEVCHGGMQR